MVILINFFQNSILLSFIIYIFFSFSSPPDLFDDHCHIFECIKKHISFSINMSAYNWVMPSLFINIFAKIIPSLSSSSIHS